MISSPTNLVIAQHLRREIKDSHPLDVTTFDDTQQARFADPSSFVDVLDLHHPYMTRLNVVGAENSVTLTASMEQYGFVSTRVFWGGTIAFRRPIPIGVDVPVLQLEAATWRTADDIYDSLFVAIGAPVWHGRNFDALNDSIVTGDINAVEVPYCLAINNLGRAAPAAQAFIGELTQLISQFQDWGCPVSVEVEADSD